MFAQLFNWRSLLALMAIVIVSATIFYSDFLAKKIAAEEKKKIELWVEAANEINNPLNANAQNILAGEILKEYNKGIPMIAVDETGEVMDHNNIDTANSNDVNILLKQKLEEFKTKSQPIIWRNPLDSTQNNLIYYGESSLLKQIRYFPLVQLLVVALFIIVTLITVSTRNKSTQNQVWAGMAKETAHQLGTPLSSLQGWVEILKDDERNQKIANEMSKDVDRLKLVSDRFGKIGSTPQLEEANVVEQVKQMVSYIKRRSPEKVLFTLNANEDDIHVLMNAPLFDWVIENLLKNALDAMEGKGSINIDIKNETAQVVIDVTDTGKGINAKNMANVFKPGFTTKKRGWGLGLSLSKRIINQYHKGELFVKNSEPGKGTTFRIILKK
ncbi:MAG: HAMP domain-containing histidine kinase [Sphingobacteriales bacterium]|nr:MAG: HAMP domain-containing histidine kinase [Sphingobacteriales bacterium]